MIMKGEKSAREVIKFFRRQKQQEGSIKLFGITVILQQYNRNAHEVKDYINKNYLQYTASTEETQYNMLSVNYNRIEVIDNSMDSRELSELLVLFMGKQIRTAEEIRLKSIDVILPKPTDAEKISAYIRGNSKYKSQVKYQGDYPIIEIAY